MTDETQTAQDEPVMTFEMVNTEEGGAPSPSEQQKPVEPAEPAPAPEAEEEPEEAHAASKRPSKGIQKRFSELTQEIRARDERIELERAERARIERENQAARELLKSLGHEVAPAPAEKPLTQADVDRLANERAAKIAADNAFNARCNQIFEAGKQAYPDFAESVESLQVAGVLSGRDTSFLEAVMEADKPEQVLHHLADDPDEAIRLAGLPPVKRTAELMKLSAKLNAPKKPAPVSKAPAPIEPITGTTQKGFDPLDESVPIDRWMEEMDRADAAKRKRQAERGY